MVASSLQFSGLDEEAMGRDVPAKNLGRVIPGETKN
jgi:hypothetical protein